MNEETSKSSPAKRGGWLRKLLLIGGLLLGLLVVAFFVVTSGAFVKAVVLPKVGAAINADLAVGDVQFSPFSQLVLRDVKLTPKGAEPLLTASLVRARYSLFAILRGNIVVDEVTVESANVTLLENPDGTSNLDPVLKGLQSGTNAAPATTAKSSAPPSIDVKSVSLKNATVRRTKNLQGGGRESLELANVNFTATNLKNGATGKLDLAAALAMDNSATNNTGSLSAKLNGEFTFDLAADLKPGRVSGKAAFKLEKTSGNFVDFSALALALDCDASPTEIKQLALRFTQSGQPLGEVRVSGPFDATKTEGKLTVAILSLDRRVLNLAGTASGIDFGTTVVNSTNVIELTKGGAAITASGQLDASSFRITRQGQTTPTLDLRCAYDVTVDRPAQVAVLKTVNLTGMQGSRLLLSGALSSPMTIPFGTANSTAPDAALNLNLTDLNLADWRAFAADLAPAGLVNLKTKLASQQGGKLLTFDLDGGVRGLGAKFGEQKIAAADVKLLVRGRGTDMKQFKLDEYRVELAQQGQSVLTLSGTGTFDSAAQDADMQVVLQATLARLLALFPQPDASLTGGTVELKARVTSHQTNQTAVGQFTLANLSGRYGTFSFADFGTAVELDVAMKAKQLEIRKAAGSLRSGDNVGGAFEVTGSVDTASKAGQLALKLTDFNQNALRPFLESALGDKKLVSVSLNTTAAASFQANGDAAVKADLQLANLSGQFGTVNFADFGTVVNLDVAMKAKQLEIRKAAGSLRSGGNAGGAFEVTGSVDTASKAGQLALKLTDFNQNALRPFLESALGDKKLVSVSLNTTAAASFQANGDAAVKADLQLANLVVNDPKGALPKTPLEAKARLDASVTKSVAQVRQCELTLTPTERASNKLNLTGSVDYSKTNATSGSLKLAADALDVTRYYDLFAGSSNAPAKSVAPSPAPPADKEPDVMKLPFSNFSLEATVGKFYLREVEATNVQFVVKLDSGRVLLKPAQLVLNGAPVNATADLDLSVPGYKYDVTLGAKPIPLEPLVNSFVPERKGQLHGVTLANANLKGAGITGASLRKNLSGDFGFASTNLNLAIPNLQSKAVKEVINAIVGIPDLIKNPTAALGNLLGRLTGGGGGGGNKSGFAEELMSRPIDAIQVQGRALDGKITLEQAEIRSSAFQASAAGVITLADILTNSAISFPVKVSLSRAFADKVGLAGNTPTNQLMVALPDFLTMHGTIGKPEKKVNGMALGAVALKAGAGVASQIGGATGGQVGAILNSLSGLVGGNPPPATSANPAPAAPSPAPAPTSAPASSTLPPAAPNANRVNPATSAPPANPPAAQQKKVNFLDLLGPQPPPANTNAPRAATNAPTSNTQTQQINLLDLFKKPKKQ